MKEKQFVLILLFVSILLISGCGRKSYDVERGKIVEITVKDPQYVYLWREGSDMLLVYDNTPYKRIEKRAIPVVAVGDTLIECKEKQNQTGHCINPDYILQLTPEYLKSIGLGTYEVDGYSGNKCVTLDNEKIVEICL